MGQKASPYFCEFEGCVATFGRLSDAKRHSREFHNPPLQCPFPGCKWKSRRVKRVREHLLNTHPYALSNRLNLQVPLTSVSTKSYGQLEFLPRSEVTPEGSKIIAKNQREQLLERATKLPDAPDSSLNGTPLETTQTPLRQGFLKDKLPQTSKSLSIASLLNHDLLQTSKSLSIASLLSHDLPQTSQLSLQAPSEPQKFRPSAPASYSSYADPWYTNAGEVNQHAQQPRAICESTHNQGPPVRQHSSMDNILLSKERPREKGPREKRLSVKKPQMAANSSRRCLWCQNTETNMWKGPDGPSQLCNVCGLVYRRYFNRLKF